MSSLFTLWTESYVKVVGVRPDIKSCASLASAKYCYWAATDILTYYADFALYLYLFAHSYSFVVGLSVIRNLYNTTDKM